MRNYRRKMLHTFLLASMFLLSGNAHSRDRKAKKKSSKGLAAKKKNDSGLKAHKAVLFFEDFEGKNPALVNSPWGGKPRRAVATKKRYVFAGKKSLESRNKKSKHAPWDTYAKLKKSADAVYLRFYTRFEKGYDFGGGVKGPGISAWAKKGAPAGGSGTRPNGKDKFIARVCFDRNGAPYLYYYHMDMGKWGSNGKQNQGKEVRLTPGKWYAIEMLLQANDPAKKTAN